MSHLSERKEKDCLNCGAAVHGRYCHVCGQENIEPKESFWHLVTHFVYDVTHFDGKFFSTLKYLLFKPGFISHEYLKGRRASYLHPIRMYVFTSAIFFLIFFSTQKEDEVVKINDRPDTAAEIIKDLEKSKQKMQKRLHDTLPQIAKTVLLKNIENYDSDIALIRRDTTAKDKLHSRRNSNFFGGTAGNKYKSIASYDSAQLALPPGKRDNFFERRFTKHNIYLKEKYKGDDKAMFTAIMEKFRHLFPQMLFVSLPLFALALQLLYVRRRKFYYVNHVVFSIHLYCGTFIIILAGMLFSYLATLINAHSLTQWVGLIFTLAGFFYWYKSMRNFYEQRRGKTILKYILALFMAMIIMVIIFVFFFIFSAMVI